VYWHCHCSRERKGRNTTNRSGVKLMRLSFVMAILSFFCCLHIAAASEKPPEIQKKIKLMFDIGQSFVLSGEVQGPGEHCQSSSECAGSSMCQSGWCSDPGSNNLPPGAHCQSSSECAGSSMCQGGWCSDPGSNNLPPGAHCQSSSECTGSSMCVNNFCN